MQTHKEQGPAQPRVWELPCPSWPVLTNIPNPGANTQAIIVGWIVRTNARTKASWFEFRSLQEDVLWLKTLQPSAVLFPLVSAWQKWQSHLQSSCGQVEPEFCTWDRIWSDRGRGGVPSANPEKSSQESVGSGNGLTSKWTWGLRGFESTSKVWTI